MLGSVSLALGEEATPRPATSGNPSTQGPTQAELNNADTEPSHWLTSNKGYLGYRYSRLDQINTRNVDGIGQVCAFKVGERGSFQGAPLEYEGVLYITTGLNTYAMDATNCRPIWAYQHKPGPAMGQHNNKGAAIGAGRVVSRHPRRPPARARRQDWCLAVGSRGDGCERWRIRDGSTADLECPADLDDAHERRPA